MSNFSITINPLALAVHVILGGLFMLFILRNPGGGPTSGTATDRSPGSCWRSPSLSLHSS